MTKTRVLLIDDHPLLRKGLAQLINDEDGLEVVGEASNGIEGIELADSLAPDLILLDLNMKGMDGLETLKLMRARNIFIKVVVLTVSEHKEDVAAMFRAGADGYLLKDMEPDDLLDNIARAASGKLAVDDRLAEILASVLRPQPESNSKLDLLTPKEQEALRFIAEGDTNKVIARKMAISEGTVKVHVKRLLRKLGCRSRVEAAVWFINRAK
ncbi:two-component system response regulator NarL [Endozoicomonas lisbonensis]|uniref:Two-component system nitrate/nitrite response regulator NarL n=1 Tax=Endozoicomonas lisbonensis TaxID=3120522 RepID=A0ABV2SNU7_9GAMM